MNQSFHQVTIAVNAAQSVKGLDPLDAMELDTIIAGIEHLPVQAFDSATKPHNTRKNQRIVRDGRLVVSMTRKGTSVRIQHVKVLVAADLRDHGPVTVKLAAKVRRIEG